MFRGPGVFDTSLICSVFNLWLTLGAVTPVKSRSTWALVSVHSWILVLSYGWEAISVYVCVSFKLLQICPLGTHEVQLLCPIHEPPSFVECILTFKHYKTPQTRALLSLPWAWFKLFSQVGSFIAPQYQKAGPGCRSTHPYSGFHHPLAPAADSTKLDFAYVTLSKLLSQPLGKSIWLTVNMKALVLKYLTSYSRHEEELGFKLRSCGMGHGTLPSCSVTPERGDWREAAGWGGVHLAQLALYLLPCPFLCFFQWSWWGQWAFFPCRCNS